MMPIGGVPTETGSAGRELGTRPTRRRGGGTPPPPAQEIDWAGIVKAVQDEWDKAAREQYGGYYALIDKYPEIRDLLLKAVNEKWLKDRFQYEIQQTKWFKETTAIAREWDLTSGLDPANTQERIRKRELEVRTKAQALGVTLSVEASNKIAVDSLRLGFDVNDLNKAIIAESERGGTSNLSRGFIGQSVRTSGNNYGVRLSEESISSWTARIATGQDSIESFENYLMNTAKLMYPTLSDGFDRGLSFGDMTSPYAEAASRILEIPASQIDFTDPKYARALGVTDAKGEIRFMSFGEWNDYLRSDPQFGYEYTDQAKERAYTVVNRLAELFGAA